MEPANHHNLSPRVEKKRNGGKRNRFITHHLPSFCLPFPSVCSVRRASCTGGTRKETTLSWRRREGGGGVGRGFPSPGECVSDAIKQISVGGTLVDVRRRDGPAIDADRIGGSVTQSPSQPRHQQTPSCSSPSVVRTPSDRSVAEFCRVTDSVVGSPKRSFCVCVCVCVLDRAVKGPRNRVKSAARACR